MIQQNFLHF
jgi:hypothetical protein